MTGVEVSVSLYRGKGGGIPFTLLTQICTDFRPPPKHAKKVRLKSASLQTDVVLHFYNIYSGLWVQRRDQETQKRRKIAHTVKKE